MHKMQYCRCRINLAGQNCHTVIIDEFNPVSWPEVQVLLQLHGEENVMDIAPVGIGETYPSAEKNRLIAKYGARVVEACFPGRAFRMDYVMTADEDLPRYDKDGQQVNPTPPPPAQIKKNGEDDHDDGEDETIAAKPTLEPIFKPGRHKPQPTAA